MTAGLRAFTRAAEGQVIVLFAAALPVFLLLAIIAVDTGRYLVDREHVANAARLAAEAAVSLAADPTGRDPSPAAAQRVVAESLRRNLPGESYSFDVVSPAGQRLSTYSARVHVEKAFVSTIQRVRFLITVDAAARLTEPPPTPVPTAPPTPSPAPTPSAAPRTCYVLFARMSPTFNFQPDVYIDGIRIRTSDQKELFAAPGSTHTYIIDPHQGIYAYGEFTLPFQVFDSWTAPPRTIRNPGFGVQTVVVGGNRGQWPQCP